MPAQDMPDFGLARLNSVRVGEEEEDVEFRNTLNAGISTYIVDLLQENSPNNLEVCTEQLVDYNGKIILFLACCPTPDQCERCYHPEECTGLGNKQ